jgi:hypothetical protein
MSNESKYHREADTIRDLPKSRAKFEPELRDTVPEQVGVYVGPRPLAPTAEHRTIQIKPVLLASHVDPRRAPTELRLYAPPKPRRRSPAWLVPLGLVAIAIGAMLAARWNGKAIPAPERLTTSPAAAVEMPKTPDAPAEDAPARNVTSEAERTAAPEVAFTALPTAPPAVPAAPARKKKRDPWLE